MANPSNSSLERLNDLIDTFTLDDKSIESPPDHNQTISNLHISITNDTKPKLPANTTSTDDADSNNEEQDIKTNDQYDTPSPDQQRERSITPTATPDLCLEDQIANSHKNTMSDLDEPEPKYKPQPASAPLFRPRRNATAKINLPQISNDDDEKYVQNDTETMHRFSNSFPKSPPRLAPVGGGETRALPHSMDLSAVTNSRSSSNASISYGETLNAAELKMQNTQIVNGFNSKIVNNISVQHISKQILACYHEPEKKVCKHPTQFVRRASASTSNGSGSTHRYSNTSTSSNSSNKSSRSGSGCVTPFSPSQAANHGTGRRGSISMVTDEIKGDPASAANEENKEESIDVVPDMVKPGGDGHDHNKQKRSSLVGLGPILRQLSDERKQDNKDAPWKYTETRHRASIIYNRKSQRDIPMENGNPPSTTNEAAHDNGNDMELDLSEMVRSGGDGHADNTESKDEQNKDNDDDCY